MVGVPWCQRLNGFDQTSEAMVQALKEAGAEVKFTVYSEAGHDAWTQTYENPDLYRWLLEHKRKAIP